MSISSCNKEDDFSTNESQSLSEDVKEKGWIGLKQSKQSAVNFLNSQNKNAAKNTDIPKFSESDIEETLGILDDNNNTLIYIHNLNNGGFIAMSGSVYEVPVLAYSNDSKFSYDSLPEELSLWLYLGSKKIAYMQEKGSSYNHNSNWSDGLGLIDQWGNYHPAPEFETTILEEYDRSVSGPLLNALWGQGVGFNTNSPDLGCTGSFTRGSNAWAGCVPVAMGQIMHYHQWPNNHNWASMPNRLYRTGANVNIPSNGQNNIALLLRQLGNQLGASWGCDGTSASNSNVKGVFNLNSYNASNPIDYTFDLVKAQTTQNRPVYISGANEKVANYAIRWTIFGTKINVFKSYSYKGHAWVADGAKEHVVVTKVKNKSTNREFITTNVSKYIHFNWGWTEAEMSVQNPINYNGWYFYDLFYPGLDTDQNNLINFDDDYEEVTAPYNMRRKIITNIIPN